MLYDFLSVERPLVFEVADDLPISFLNMKPLKIGDRRDELTCHVNGARHRSNASGFEDTKIVFAECGCLMDDTSPCFCRDVVINQHLESA